MGEDKGLQKTNDDTHEIGWAPFFGVQHMKYQDKTALQGMRETD